MLFHCGFGGKRTIGSEWTQLEGVQRFKHRLFYVYEGEAACAQGTDEWVPLRPTAMYLVPGSGLMRRRCDHSFGVAWMNFQAVDIDVNDAIAELVTVQRIEFPGWEHWEPVADYFPRNVPKTFTVTYQIQAMLADIVTNLVSEAVEEKRARSHSPLGQALRRAATYMDEHATEQPDLNQVASQVDLSPHYFHRQFQKMYRITPRQYLERHRMRLAMHLLADKGLKVGEAAAQTGYDCAYHFSRVFRKFHKRPPSAVRSSGQLPGP